MIKIKIDVHSLFLYYRFLPSLSRLEIQPSWQCPFCCLPQYSFGCFFLWIAPAHNEGLRLFNGIDNSPYEAPWGAFFVICCLRKTSILKFLLALCQGLRVTNLYAKIGSTRARKRLFPLVTLIFSLILITSRSIFFSAFCMVSKLVFFDFWHIFAFDVTG